LKIIISDFFIDMSSLALYAAPIDNNDNASEMNDIDRKRQTRSKTLKKRPNPGSHVTSMINHIHQSESADDSTDTNMADFSPPPPPESAGMQRRIYNEPSISNDDGDDSTKPDGPVTTEGFDKLPNTYSSDYYNKYVPYYNKMSQSTGNKDELLEKLNYMIHLLEEQQDDKTGHVTEEIILYSFLGVFMIFIVDSFARAGKYVR
jgi:hypothetical protein|tara:strand:- start:546 stop:1157 length:612 start_codon:yes stop_codon:yes gene_type:complete